MEENHDLLLERQERMLATMRGEKTDRPPLFLSGDIALARYYEPELTFKEVIFNHTHLAELVAGRFIPEHPKVDMLDGAGRCPRNQGSNYLVHTMLPGVELPDNNMWQLVFDHFMEEEDYDKIIDGGWAAFREYHLFERLKYSKEDMAAVRKDNAWEAAQYRAAGLPFLGGGMMAGPFDILAFCRGTDFYIDMLEIPEKVHAAMDVILEEDLAMQEKGLDDKVKAAAEKGEAYMVCVAPCVQANCDLVGRALFEEFGWPHIERQTNFLLDHGCYVRFHMDANWTNNLDLFTTFPKGRCLFDSDGKTDETKMRDLLGPVMAFTGSVEPATMAFGKPDQVYKEVKRQIEELGDSVVVSPSCTLPANAPKENIDAMYAAIDEL